MKLALYLRREQMTGEELAARAGLASSTISRILSGHRRPGLEVMRRIARATEGMVSTLDDFVLDEAKNDAA